MAAVASDVARALDRLRDALGPDRVLAPPAAADEIRRRSLNPVGDGASIHLVRPASTEECRVAVDVLAALGRPPRVIGGLTTFWEPQPLDGIVIDTLGLTTPARVDVRERIGYVGAAVTVRDLDRVARREGLCLVAYPDSDGSASLGSMAAVACTAGLGMARVSPVRQIVGLTVVTPDATIVRTGASWRLGHGGIADGMPDPTGVFLGAQGRFGVITEVVVALEPAPHLAARTWTEPTRPTHAVADALRHARDEIDRGVVDSLRLETIAPGGGTPTSTEWFVRCWRPDGAAEADACAAGVAARLGARDARAWVETAAGRRGELPDHDARYAMPPGTHHARTGRQGFLGLEVNVNWGDQLDASLALFAALFDALVALPLGHVRLGIYPAPHTVSIGAQAMLAGGTATAEAVRAVVAGFVEPLAALGALPYRPGRSWQAIVDRREATDPACALVRRAAAASRSS